MDVFTNRADKCLSGRGTIEYVLNREPTAGGRVFVRVTQNVKS